MKRNIYGTLTALLGLAATLALVAPMPSRGIVLEDFSDGGFSLSNSDATPESNDQLSVANLAGDRFTQINAVSGGTVDVSVSGGALLSTVTGSIGQGAFNVQFDFSGSPLDLTATPAFQFDFSSLTATVADPLFLQVTVFSGLDEHFQSLSLDVSGAQAPLVDFTGWGTVNPAAIDYIIFDFGSGPDPVVPFQLDQISIVIPEPLATILIATGAGAMFLLRRRG